jgi:ubiquinone/menaquinone biosynthesis C-methylase UbiE
VRVTAIDGHRIWAAGYDDALNPLLALETRALLEKLPTLAGSRFLDVACGTGRWTRLAQQRGARVFGVDLCPEMLFEAARKSGLAGRLSIGDARSLPLAGGAADLTLCSFALGYIAPLRQAIAEMARVTRRAARIIVTDLHPCALAAGWTRSFRSDRQVYEMDHHPHAIADWEAAAESAGLALEWRLDACFAEPERAIFTQAGKDSSFEELRRIPAVLAMCWSKSCD